jgi:sec-independent protein translocase protein TatA
MGSFSVWHWLILILVVLLLFGRGKISDLMGDMAKGIKSFKKGLADEPNSEAGTEVKSLDRPSEAVKSEPEKAKS